MPVEIKVKDAMDDNVQFVESGTSVKDALRTMIEKDVWSVVVLKKGLAMGVVTEHDILRRVVAKGFEAGRVQADAIMSSPLILIEPDASIGEALTKMVEKGVRRLYIGEKGKIVGRITEKSVMESTLNVMLTLKSS